MANIDEKIKVLLRKKAKIQLLNEVRVLMSHLPQDPDGHLNLTQEVFNTIDTFLTLTVNSIETSEDVTASTSGHLSSQTRQDIKRTSDAIAAEEEIRPFKPSDPLVVQERKLKIQFAKDHQKLAGREVRFESDSGETVSGKVVSLLYPNVVVETDAGTVSIKPENLL